TRIDEALDYVVKGVHLRHIYLTRPPYSPAWASPFPRTVDQFIRIIGERILAHGFGQARFREGLRLSHGDEQGFDAH
ncbi:MAG: hypothetical protein AAF253_06815, partial [Pseudomonadota bacterium]